MTDIINLDYSCEPNDKEWFSEYFSSQLRKSSGYIVKWVTLIIACLTVIVTLCHDSSSSNFMIAFGSVAMAIICILRIASMEQNLRKSIKKVTERHYKLELNKDGITVESDHGKKGVIAYNRIYDVLKVEDGLLLIIKTRRPSGVTSDRLMIPIFSNAFVENSRDSVLNLIKLGKVGNFEC